MLTIRTSLVATVIAATLAITATELLAGMNVSRTVTGPVEVGGFVSAATGSLSPTNKNVKHSHQTRSNERIITLPELLVEPAD
jgi:hypothetical protein